MEGKSNLHKKNDGPYRKYLTPLARVFSHRSRLSRVVESKIAPSGRYHLALMFGPIIIESGVPRYATMSIYHTHSDML